MQSIAQLIRDCENLTMKRAVYGTLADTTFKFNLRDVRESRFTYRSKPFFILEREEATAYCPSRSARPVGVKYIPWLMLHNNTTAKHYTFTKTGK